MFLADLTDFERGSPENYKDFWDRLARCSADLEALGIPMVEKVVFNRSIRALRLPDGKLPIALSALETRPGRFSVSALRGITIRMYETHNPGGDPTEVYSANPPETSESQHNHDTTDGSWDNYDWRDYDDDQELNRDGEVSEAILEDGPIMLGKPKKSPKKKKKEVTIEEVSSLTGSFLMLF